jgi:hypothetical protein
MLSPRAPVTTVADVPAPELNDEREDSQPALTPGETPTPKPAPVEKTPAPGSESDLIRAIRALPKPELKLGDGKITGRVIDVDGNPLRGVTIQAQPPRTEPMRYPRILDYEGRDLHEGLEEDIRLMLRQRAISAPPELRAESAADGTWQINGIGEGKYVVYPRAKGYQLYLSKYEFFAGDDVTIYATPLVELQIQVLTAEGVPTTEFRPDIRDVITGSSNPNFYTENGRPWFPSEDDHFTMLAPAGVYLVSVATQAHGSADPVLVEMKLGEPQKVTLQLGAIEWNGLRGKLVFEGGDPSGSHNVAHALVQPGTTAADTAATLAKQDMRRVQPLRGEYALPLSQTGNYVVAVFLDLRMVHWIEVAYAGGSQIQDIELQAPAADDSIVCEIIAPPGRSFSADFGLQTQDGRREIRLTAWKISDREYRIIPPSDAELGEKLPRAIIAKSSIGDVEVPILHLQAQRLRAEFKPRTALLVDVGRWTLPAGHERPLQVELRRDDGSRVESASWYRGGAVPAILSNVQPGNYRLFVGLDYLTLIDEPIGVSGAYVRKSVELPVLRQVTISGVDMHGRAKINGPFITRENGMPVHAFEGDTVNVYLPDGEYTLSWRKGGEREDTTAALSVAGDTTYTLPK